jgi:hypothetical protein
MSGKKRGNYDKPLALDLDFGEALERLAQTDPKEADEEASKAQALRLVQHEEGGPSFLIYATDRGIKTELRFEGETPWFSYQQLGEIFGVDENTAIDHVQNFLTPGELDDSTTRKFRVVREEGGRQVTREIKHFGLDVAFYVGYRVNSAQGVLFRRWATAILIQIAKHGYYMDVERLKDPGAPSVVDEVKSELYEIRASTTNAYREVLRIFALCADYDGGKTANERFARMENTMLFAATGRTAPELIMERADAAKPQMGLTFYRGKNGPIQRDVKTGNNYLYQDEAAQKNLATVMLLDYFTDQANQGKLVTMDECETKMRGFIKFNQWELLDGKGKVSRTAADEHALEQLRRFKSGEIEDLSGEKPALPKPKKN